MFHSILTRGYIIGYFGLIAVYWTMRKFDLRSATEDEEQAIKKRAIAMPKSGRKNVEIVECLGVNKNSVANYKLDKGI